MFAHYLKYSFKSILRARDVLFWTLLFPIALATFMYTAFGTIYEKDEQFHEIPVAVIDSEKNAAFKETVNALSGDEKVLSLKTAKDIEAAKEMLRADKIKGIYVVDEEISLIVKENGIKETVLNMILTEFEQYNTVIENTLKDNPQNVETIVKNLMSEKSYYTEKPTSEGNSDPYVTYFYAVFAMSCLFAGFSGTNRAARMQADTTSLGIRRNIAPNSKIYLIGADFISAFTVQVLFEIIAFLYMKFVLGIDFGTKYLGIILVLVMGSGIGLAMGMIVGCIRNKSIDAKVGIVTGIAMTLSVMADLTASGVRDLIEHHAPIINRINPAALIVDSFYALNVYDTYDRFIGNIIILGVIISILLLCSFLLVRRTRYASI